MTIPANEIVNVVPSVLPAGGTGVTGLGLMLTRNSRVPVGTVQSFASQAAMNAYFGATDQLAIDSGIYFAGFAGATQQPSALLVAQFPQTAVAAYLRGGNLSSLTLAQLQAINGTLSVTFDGYARSGNVNLLAATSFTNAASLIQTALNSAVPGEASVTGSIAPSTTNITASIGGYVLTVTSVSGTVALGSVLGGSGVAANTHVTGQLSGTPGGIGTYAIDTPQTVASEAMTTTCGLLTVTAVASGALAVGQTIGGSGVLSATMISQLGAVGAGGTGTYFVNLSQTVLSEALTGSATAVSVTYDSVSGGFLVTSGVVGPASTSSFAAGTAAALLFLTQATGAVLSQGAAPQTPAAFMTALVSVNQAWANWMTHFDPDAGSGNALKQQFAAWKNTASALGPNRFGYFCWDPDASPASSSNAATSLGQILKANGDSGTLLVWEGGNATGADNGLCAFALGVAASINYSQTNGRTDFAFRAQAGLVANVTDPVTAGNLTANGYCFYGAYASAQSSFIWFQNGQISGAFEWADTYQTQIWMNTFFQQALLTLFQNALSVPFTQAGITLIQQTLQTVINAALSFGAFAPNVLTAGQIAEVNAQAGASIATVLQAQGWYLQITLPSQTVQAARGPWPITFWYIDRNSVQSINLSSVEVQ